MLTSQQIIRIEAEASKNNRVFSSIFYALGDRGRLKIFRLLLKNQNICVSDIARILNVSVPAASRQLKILEQADLAVRERMGQMICYRINKANPLVKALISMLKIKINPVTQLLVLRGKGRN